MKLAGSSATAYLRKPDPAHAGILIFGADGMQVSDHRQTVVRALVGPHGEDEMRLTRLNGAELRKDAALLDDAIKAQGFFPGHRVALVEEATDGLAKLFASVLADWQAGDAQLVVTAGQLTAKSPLRKIFESHPNAVCIGIYDNPPVMQDVHYALAEAGIPQPDHMISEMLLGLAGTISPGDFRQTLAKLALYKRDDETPVTAADVLANTPQSAEVDVDDILDIVATGQVTQLGPKLQALYAQGVLPVTLCIGAMRHFRRLHAAASDPGGAAAGAGRLRPPVFGPRRDQLVRQAGQWGSARLEKALAALTDTDLQLRSSSRAPAAALMERTLIRLAMMARR